MILRRAGYGEMTDPKTGDVSYMLRFGRTLYPRFHAYLEALGGGFQVNLHLDQKQASYSGTTAHSGEYDGPAVEDEAARITRWVEYFRIKK